MSARRCFTLLTGSLLAMLAVTTGRLQAACCGEIIPPIGFTNGAVIQTGGLDPLVGQSWTLTYDTRFPQHWLHFTFGFATEERPDDGEIFDALSVDLVNLLGLGEADTNVALLLTADAAGLIWAPPTPGAVEVNPNQIFRQTIAFPAFQPVLPAQEAYEVRALLPGPFDSGTVRFDFQLFDYPNGQNSFAWCLTPYIVSVPEPSMIALAAAGCLLAIVFRRQRP